MIQVLIGSQNCEVSFGTLEENAPPPTHFLLS